MPDPASPVRNRLPRWAVAALSLLAVLSVVRASLLVGHAPLLAFANSYDQIRYSACFDLAPWRPGVPPDRANTPAPYSRFAFQPLPAGWCVATSDFLFTAPVALGWRASEALGGRPIHSVRRLAELRLLAWFAVAAWATFVFVREQRIDLAIANLAAFAIVAMDPGNTLYLATFYAEAAAAFGLYVCGMGTVVAMVRPTRAAFALAAAGALMLATSKFQHLALPMLLGATILVAGGRAYARIASALILAGALGFGIQLANGARDTPAAQSVVMNNRADFVLSVLLVHTSDTERVVRALDLDADCVAYAGKSVYAMAGPVEKTCTSVAAWRNATLWWLLVSDPPALAHALAEIPRMLLPWQPGYLGVVEDADHGALPTSSPGFNLVFGNSVIVAWSLLLLPWSVFIGCLVVRARAPSRAFALACATGSTAVVVVALLGDGHVEFAKHAHLAIDFAIASLCVPLAALVRRGVADETFR